MIGRGLIVGMTLFLSSCAAIPSKFMDQVDPDLTYAVAKRAPDRYRGRVLLLGGTVSERAALPEATRLRIYEHSLDSRDRPHIGGPSEGDFFIVIRPAVDLAKYPPGEQITVVGKLTGVEPVAGHDPLPSFDVLYLRAWGLPSLTGEKTNDQPSCRRIYGIDC